MYSETPVDLQQTERYIPEDNIARNDRMRTTNPVSVEVTTQLIFLSFQQRRRE
jgi:hypothetical protein